MREFKSFGAFANHLRRMYYEQPFVTAAIAEQAGELVEKRAKERIGHYQGGVGPFVQWVSLKPSTEAYKAAHGYPSNAPLLATGDMRDSIRHIVQRRFSGASVTVGSNDPKIAFHEYGTSKMPPRPVLGPAMYGAKHEIQHIAAETMAEFFAGKNWRRRR